MQKPTCNFQSIIKITIFFLVELESHLDELVLCASSSLQRCALALTYLSIIPSLSVNTRVVLVKLKMFHVRVVFTHSGFFNLCCFSHIGYLVHYILYNFVYQYPGGNCILVKTMTSVSSNVASYELQCQIRLLSQFSSQADMTKEAG